MVDFVRHCCGRICIFNGRGVADASIDPPLLSLPQHSNESRTPSATQLDRNEASGVTDRSSGEDERVRLSLNLFAPRNPSFPCNSFVLPDEEDEDQEDEKFACSLAPSNMTSLEAASEASTAQVLSRQVSVASSEESICSDGDALFDSQSGDALFASQSGVAPNPDVELVASNSASSIPERQGNLEQVDSSGCGVVPDVISAQYQLPGLDLRGSKVRFVDEVVDEDMPLQLPVVHRDPFQRTASERRLANLMQADAGMDDRRWVDLSDRSPAGILKRSPSEQWICNDEGVWPPRATFFLALEARNSRLQHLGSSGKLDSWRSWPSMPRLPEDEDDDDDDGQSLALPPLRGKAAATAGTPETETPATTRLGDSRRFDDDTPSTDDEASDIEAQPEQGLFSWFLSRGTPARPGESPLNLDPTLSPQVTTASLLKDLGMARKPGGRVCGAIMLTGTLTAKPAEICDSLRQALTALLYPVVENRVVICVWRGVDASASNAVTDMCREQTKAVLSLAASQPERFRFELVLQDSSGILKAFEALKLEAASGGALSMLPALADAMPEAGRLSLRIEVGPMPNE